jgi:transcriptional regulator with XRE-family HTH domain
MVFINPPFTGHWQPEDAMKTTKQLLGARIKELRKERQMSQEQLAEAVGIEPKHMSRIEVGGSYPSLSRLERIALILGVPMRDLFDFQHLEDADYRVDDIAGMVKDLDEEQQRTVYKVVRAFKK